MDELGAAQLLLIYSGFLGLVYGIAARKFNQIVISRLSRLEKQIEDEVSYLDSFRDMGQTEKYRILSITLNHIKSLNYRKRFIPVSSTEADILEAECLRYCRR